MGGGNAIVVSTVTARNFYRNLAPDFFGGFDDRFFAWKTSPVGEVSGNFKNSSRDRGDLQDCSGEGAERDGKEKTKESNDIGELGVADFAGDESEGDFRD